MKGSKEIVATLITVAALYQVANAQTVDAPVFSEPSGASPTTLSVQVDCLTVGSVIHYTLTGAEPTIYDPVIQSGQSITISRTTTLKAKAWLSGNVSSTTSSFYEITGQISAGGQHIIALRSNFLAYGWGNQANGRLGNGVTTNTNQTTAGQCKYTSSQPIANALKVAAGYSSSVILDSSGSRSVWAFGYGAFGENGNNSNAHQSYAVKVQKSTTSGDFLENCTDVSAGQYFNGAVSDGYVYTWGSQANGRIGSGATTGTRHYAGRVKTSQSGNPDLGGILRIEFGDAQGLALEGSSMGYVWGWGLNANGQLGDGTTSTRAYASRVKLNATTELTDAWAVSTADTHSAVIRWKVGVSDLQGTVWTFGSRLNGRLGDNGAVTGSATYPVVVVDEFGAPLQQITQISLGGSHSLALDKNGNVWAWGANTSGALGDNTTTQRAYAVKVKDPNGNGQLGGIAAVAAGGSGASGYSLALAKNGVVFAWGSNADGQLANGTASSGANKLPAAVGGFSILPQFNDVQMSAQVATPGIAPGTVELVAQVTHPSEAPALQQVEIYHNGNVVETLTAAPWSKTVSNLPQGNHHTYAVLRDVAGNVAYSLPQVFEINPSNTADTDADGLTDAWEFDHFGDLSQNGNGDPDGDGLTNKDEMLMGTDPNSTAFEGASGYESYLYDDLDRLRKVQGVGSDKNRDYDLDPAGNIKTYE